jgi:hypothetical protein
MKIFNYLIIILFISCQSGDKKNIYSDGNNPKSVNGLNKGRELKFTLDFTTISLSPNYQYFEDENKERFLATLTPVENSLFINVFDIKKMRIVRKVEIQKDGPNAIPGVMNFHIIDAKRILIYSYPTLLTIVDFEGKILNQRNFLDIPYQASLFTTKAAPLGWIGELGRASVFVAPELVNEADPNIPAISLLDIEDGKMEFLVSRSSFDNVKHKTSLSFLSYTFNSKQNQFIAISQRGDQFHIQSIGDKEKFIDVPSTIKLPPLKVYGQPDISYEGSFKNDRFLQIVYDEWRSIYYLIKAKALTDGDYEERNPNQFESLPLEIIVLDEEFKVLDKVDVKRGEYFVQMGGVGLFVSPDGLHLMKYETESDDYMVFDTFEFVR